MKQLIILLLAASGVLPSFAQQKKLSTREIIKEFYARYDITSYDYPKIQLEKQDHSWYVYTMSFDYEKQNRQLFYDARKGIFQPLQFPAAKQGQAYDINDKMSDVMEYDFDVHPSYGYDGWYWDVIGSEGKKKDLSVPAMYSLARAYSAAASAHLSRQFGDALEKDLFHAPLKRNSLTEMQADKYLDLGYKAYRLYQTIAQQQPAFQTKVGAINLKAANELMTCYHNTLVYAENFLNKVQLPDDLYHPDSLWYAKEVLLNCPENAVLVTFGDNDFYPALFLQAKGVRPDVYLINYNLFGMERYIFRATTPQFAASPIRINYDTIDYRDDQRNYYRLFKPADTILDYSKAKSIFQLKQNGPLPTNKILLNGPASASGAIQAGTGYVVELQGEYLHKEQWILLDILANLNGRKICFTYPFNDQLRGLNNFLEQKGYLFQYMN